jgi:hypothetical protein
MSIEDVDGAIVTDIGLAARTRVLRSTKETRDISSPEPEMWPDLLFGFDIPFACCI